MSRDPDTTGTAGIPRQDALRPDGSGGSTAPLVPPPPVDRRGFLFKLGLAINAVAAAAFALPLVGYVLAPRRRDFRSDRRGSRPTEIPSSCPGTA